MRLRSKLKALGIQSKNAPSSDIFGPQHLVVEGLLNFGHNAPSSGRFEKLANPAMLGIKNSNRGLFSTVYPAPESQEKCF